MVRVGRTSSPGKSFGIYPKSSWACTCPLLGIPPVIIARLCSVLPASLGPLPGRFFVHALIDRTTPCTGLAQGKGLVKGGWADR